jgi:hypothetical protein
VDALPGCRKPSGSVGSAALERGLAAHTVPTMLMAMGLVVSGSRMWIARSIARPRGAPRG